LGQTVRRTQYEQMSSELPLKADIAQHSRHVSKVPTRDMLSEAVNLGGLVRFPFTALPR